MLLLFVVVLAWVTGGRGTVLENRKCTKVNGVSGACDLKLNYFTLAGTHNAGAGAYGLMYWHSGAVAPSCYVRNQDKSITSQLELGIRYFDFDLSHLEASSGDWWERGLVLVHCNGDIGCAYSRSLRRALREIEHFLGENRDEIVLIRLKDHAEDSRDYIRQHLADEVLGIFQHSDKVRINRQSNPKLGEAIMRNERLLIHTNGQFGMGSPFNDLRQIESYEGQAGTSQCFKVMDIVNKLKGDYRIRYDDYPIQVDWYHAFGLCLWDLAGLCDGTELHKLVNINKEIVSYAHRPVSLVLIDYAGSGNLRLAEVVREMNEYNVDMFT